MDELIIKHLCGATTDIEARSLTRWRTESPENEAAYLEISALWEMTGREHEGDDASPPRVEDVVAPAEARRARARLKKGRRAVLRSPWVGYGLAAAAIAALILVRVGPRAPALAPLLVPVESSASSSEVVTMSLSDGSVVRLAADTRVEFPPSDEERLVTLAGRAFFAVSSGDAPFVVRTSLGDVTVHGTRFEVTVEDDELRLVVVEGTVSLASASGGVEVQAGQVAHMGPDGTPSVVTSRNVWELLDWGGGLLVFQETPLGEVAEELERHFDIAVSVADELRARRITAWFADEPVEDVVGAVCLVAGARCEVGDRSIVIDR